MKNMLCQMCCMLLGGILLGFNAGKLDRGIHTMLFIIGIAMINHSIYSISKRIWRRRCGTSGSDFPDSGKQNKPIR